MPAGLVFLQWFPAGELAKNEVWSASSSAGIWDQQPRAGARSDAKRHGLGRDPCLAEHP